MAGCCSIHRIFAVPTSRAFEVRQAQDGKGGDEEGEGAALDDGKADSKGGLDQGDYPRDKEDGGDYVTSGGVIILDAEGGADEKGDGDCGPEHGKVVLESEEDAEVPGRNRVNFVEDFIAGGGGGTALARERRGVFNPKLIIVKSLVVSHPRIELCKIDHVEI